jgi:hypothetical protein
MFKRGTAGRRSSKHACCGGASGWPVGRAPTESESHPSPSQQSVRLKSQPARTKIKSAHEQVLTVPQLPVGAQPFRGAKLQTQWPVGTGVQSVVALRARQGASRRQTNPVLSRHMWLSLLAGRNRSPHSQLCVFVFVESCCLTKLRDLGLLRSELCFAHCTARTPKAHSSRSSCDTCEQQQHLAAGRQEAAAQVGQALPGAQTQAQAQ